MLSEKLVHFSNKVIRHFDEIPEDRKNSLKRISLYLQENQENEKSSALLFVCTHNSRRSHFAQIMTSLALEFYKITGIVCYSGGTEATAFHPNALAALRSIGFEIQSKEGTNNPLYSLTISHEKRLECFSKLVGDASNPSSNFLAIMTCSDAEQNCPFVPGADMRVGLTYNDPKEFDGTALQEEKYLERAQQIASEMFYICSLINKP